MTLFAVRAIIGESSVEGSAAGERWCHNRRRTMVKIISTAAITSLAASGVCTRAELCPLKTVRRFP